MMNDIIFALWFFLPAGAANAAPVFANNIPILKKFTTPLDFGKSFRGRRIFGDHKTYRGLISGTLLGIITAGVQMLLTSQIHWLQSFSHIVDYSDIKTLLMGAALGFGALMGDAIKSFFKRQIGIESGKSWFPFDQTDYIIGGLLASAPFVQLSFMASLYVLIIWFIVHPVANVIGWVLHLKSRPF